MQPVYPKSYQRYKLRFMGFHRSEKRHDICLFGNGLFYQAYGFQFYSLIPLQKIIFHYYPWLNNTPQCIFPTFFIQSSCCDLISFHNGGLSLISQSEMDVKIRKEKEKRKEECGWGMQSGRQHGMCSYAFKYVS